MEFVEAALLTALPHPHQCADVRVLAGSFLISGIFFLSVSNTSYAQLSYKPASSMK